MTDKRFVSKFYGIDFYSYENVKDMDDCCLIGCTLYGKLTKELVEKMKKEYGFLCEVLAERDKYPDYEFSVKGVMPKSKLKEAKSEMKKAGGDLMYEKYVSVLIKSSDGFLFSGWKSKRRTKIKPEDLPKSFVKLDNYKKHGYLQTAGIADVEYHPSVFDDHAFKDDFLFITYTNGNLDRTTFDTLHQTCDEYVFGMDILDVIKGIEMNNSDNAILQEKVADIKKRMVDKYNRYVDEMNNNWKRGMKNIETFEELV